MEQHHRCHEPDWNKLARCHHTHTDAPSGILSTKIFADFKQKCSDDSVFVATGEGEESLVFLSEQDDDESIRGSAAPWKILIADDDTTVHDTTVLALSGVKILGRPLEFLHAFSAKEAKEVALNHPDTALILLDVVMETVDAGLRLVQVLREELARNNLRIVLRTGQPGYAGDNMMTSYAIDGYATKSKLTRSILIMMLNEVLGSDKPPAQQAN